MPEADGLGTRGHFAVDEREKADAVERHGAFDFEREELDEGGEDVHDARGGVGDCGLDARGPFDEGGDADAAVPHVSLAAAEVVVGAVCVGLFGIDPTAVVAGEPEHGVVGHAEFAEPCAECADAAVHADEFAVEAGAARGFEVGGEGFVRDVRTAKPDEDEERLFLFCGAADEFEGLGDDCLGAVAGDFFLHAVSPEGPVELEVIADGERFIEADVARRERVGFGDDLAGAGDAVEVPLSEMSGGVAGVANERGERGFLGAQLHSGPEDAHAVRVPSGEHCGAGGRAGLLGVEAVEAQPRGRHGIEVRGLDFGEAVVADVAPALVVGHAEDDVWTRRLGALSDRRQREHQSDADFREGGDHFDVESSMASATDFVPLG